MPGRLIEQAGFGSVAATTMTATMMMHELKLAINDQRKLQISRAENFLEVPKSGNIACFNFR